MKLNRVQVRRHLQDLVKYVKCYRNIVETEISDFMEGSEYVPRDIGEGWSDACQNAESSEPSRDAELQYQLLKCRLRGMAIDGAISEDSYALVMRLVDGLMRNKATPDGYACWERDVIQAMFNMFPDFDISQDFKVVKK